MSVVNQPGATSFSTTPFVYNNTSAAGDYQFTLRYSECCGSPEDLVFNLNGTTVGAAATPEPSSLELLGTAFSAPTSFTAGV